MGTYECRIDWTREGTDILKQRSLKYIRSQPCDNTYYTDGLSDGTQVAAAVVHKEEDIIIRLNDSASVLDAEITPASSTRVRQRKKRQYYNTHILFDSYKQTKQ